MLERPLSLFRGAPIYHFHTLAGNAYLLSLPEGEARWYLAEASVAISHQRKEQIAQDLIITILSIAMASMREECVGT